MSCDRIVDGDVPGEVRKTHHGSAHSPFREMAATSCGMPVDIKNAAHLKHELRAPSREPVFEKDITSQTASGSSLATLLPSWSNPPKDRTQLFFVIRQRRSACD